MVSSQIRAWHLPRLFCGAKAKEHFPQGQELRHFGSASVKRVEAAQLRIKQSSLEGAQLRVQTSKVPNSKLKGILEGARLRAQTFILEGAQLRA